MNHSDSSPNLQQQQQHGSNNQAASHRAFELVTFVDKLPLQIESLACYDNILVLGTTSGRILIYDAVIDQSPLMKLEALFQKSITVTKKTNSTNRSEQRIRRSNRLVRLSSARHRPKKTHTRVFIAQNERLLSVRDQLVAGQENAAIVCSVQEEVAVFLR